MKLFHKLQLVLLFSIYGSILASISYMLAPRLGLFVVPALIIPIVAIAALLGDRIILSLIKAEPVDLPQYRDKIDNFCYLLSLSKLRVYNAPRLPLGIYSLKGVNKNAFIVLGSDIIDSLSQEEIEALLYLAILRIKKFNLRFVQVSNTLLFVLNLPIIYLQSLSQKFSWAKYLSVPLKLLLLPLKDLKNIVFLEDQRQLKNVANVIKDSDMGRLIDSAHFKLQQQTEAAKESGSMENLLLSHLSTSSKKVRYYHDTSSSI